ncbi:MAG: glycosyltransferase family 4 protein, partial [Cyclobacteriaceae bacterium]
PAAKSYMMSRGMKEEKFINVPNGIALEEWNENGILPEEHASLLKRLRKEDQFIVGYAGSHGIANSLNSLIAACHFLSNVSVVFIGDGPEKKDLIRQARENKFNNVYFLHPVSKNNIPVLLKQFDALYVGFQKQSLLRFGMSPNKMFDYMMAEKPIIQAIHAGNNMVREYDCGIDVDPENPEAIAHGINQLKKMSSEQRAMLGRNGKAAVLAFHNYRVLAQQFSSKYLEVKNSKTAK